MPRSTPHHTSPVCLTRLSHCTAMLDARTIRTGATLQPSAARRPVQLVPRRHSVPDRRAADCLRVEPATAYPSLVLNHLHAPERPQLVSRRRWSSTAMPSPVHQCHAPSVSPVSATTRQAVTTPTHQAVDLHPAELRNGRDPHRRPPSVPAPDCLGRRCAATVVAVPQALAGPGRPVAAAALSTSLTPHHDDAGQITGNDVAPRALENAAAGDRPPAVGEDRGCRRLNPGHHSHRATCAAAVMPAVAVLVAERSA